MTNIKDYLVGQIPLIRPISVLRNTTEVTELCHQGKRSLFLMKKRVWRYGYHEHGYLRDVDRKCILCG